MDDKTMQALNVLANKLGTTAEYLWGVLLKQAPITGLTKLLVVIVCVSAAVMWFRFVLRKTSKPPVREGVPFPSADWDNDLGAPLAWVSVFLLAFLALVVTISLIPTIVSAMLNPEYWALTQILN